MNWILPLLKYWRIGGIALLSLVFLFTAWLAQERGRERDHLEQELVRSTRNFTNQIRLLEQSRIDREERDEFRNTQRKKFKTAGNAPVEFDDGLRSAYDSLRERQRSHASR